MTNYAVKPNHIESPQVKLSDAQKKALDDAVANAAAAMVKTEAIKFDSGKPDWTLVPFEALEEMVAVLEFGAKKYARWNWALDGGFKWSRVLASCLRHVFAFMRGEDKDPESGLSHIAHAQCNLLFMAYYLRNKDSNKDIKDDRNAR